MKYALESTLENLPNILKLFEKNLKINFTRLDCNILWTKTEISKLPSILAYFAI